MKPDTWALKSVTTNFKKLRNKVGKQKMGANLYLAKLICRKVKFSCVTYW